MTGAVLGLDTATARTVTGLLLADGSVHEAGDDPPAGARGEHAQRLLGLIVDVLAAGGIGWAGVARLAVGLGPGGFTGLRIGIATARALAQARALPVVGVGSLAALAAPARRAAPERPVLAAIDARRGEAFAALWVGEREVLAPRALGPDALARLTARAARPDGAEALARPTAGAPPAELDRSSASAAPVLAVGNGAVVFRDLLERAGAEVPPDDAPAHRLSGAEVCRLGARGRPTDRDALLPAYLREPDAQPLTP